MRKFGIIGNPVAQSYSARYFTQFFAENGIDAQYERYCCPTIDDARAIIGELDGFNVTIPHKQAIIPLLDELDETAAEIGAVNVVKKYQVPSTKYKGYNTDAIGFMNSIRPLLTTADKKALVLGTGGASKAVCYGLKKLGVEPKPLSRRSAAPFPQEGQGLTGYEYLKAHPEILKEYTVIVNATPLGMVPNIDTCPDIPYEELGPQHLLFDCVYNPEETLFLRRGREHGCRTQNGMGMLLGQAKAAWEIWNNL